MDNKLVGERIRQSRKKMGYTLVELGKILGVSHATLSRWENGTVDRITMASFTMLGNVLGVDPLWLSGLDTVDVDTDDDATKEVHFMADIMTACGKYDGIGDSFTDDDWKEIVAYIKMKASMKNG